MSTTDVSYVRVGPFDDPVVTFSFDAFRVGAMSLGLPATILNRLSDRGWDCQIDPDATESFTAENSFMDWWYRDFDHSGKKIVVLAKSQCFPQVGGGPQDTVSFLSTVYHEFTHAYFREFEDDLKPLIDAAKPHYLGVNLKGGKSTSDTFLVFHESAASYVGDSIDAVVRLLMGCKAATRGMNMYNMPRDDQQCQAQVDVSFRDYAKFLLQNVFGTAGGVGISVSVDSKLRAHLDVNVLEGVRDRAVTLARGALQAGNWKGTLP